MRESLYAFDAMFSSNDLVKLQSLTSNFAASSELSSIKIIIKKTVVMVQGTDEQPNIVCDGEPLSVVDEFCYPG